VEAAAAANGVPLLDVAGAMLARLPADPAAAERTWAGYWRDHNHFTPAGDRALAEALLPLLRDAGLVTVRRSGRSMIYAARFDAMNDLVGYLTENCCGGAPEKCAPVAACKPAQKSRGKQIA